MPNVCQRSFKVQGYITDYMQCLKCTVIDTANVVIKAYIRSQYRKQDRE